MLLSVSSWDFRRVCLLECLNKPVLLLHALLSLNPYPCLYCPDVRNCISIDTDADAVQVFCVLFYSIQVTVLYTLFHIHTEYYSRDSAVGIATGYGRPKGRGSGPGGVRIFTSPCHPDRL
jgi:hypothetical protein